MLGLTEDKLMEELVPVTYIGVSGLHTPVRQTWSKWDEKETIGWCQRKHTFSIHTEEGEHAV